MASSTNLPDVPNIPVEDVWQIAVQSSNSWSWETTKWKLSESLLLAEDSHVQIKTLKK